MVCLYHGGGNGPAGMTATFVALHVAPHAEGFTTTRVGAAEGLLSGVAVGVDAETGRSREGLVARSADVSVVVLLVGGRAGGREVVVMLPGRGDRGDHLLVCGGWQRSSGGRHAAGRLVGGR